MNKNKQKIKCNVESCTFQNNSINCCTLPEIEIDCTCDNDKAKTEKETICKSFKTNIN
ncbi:MAG: DUF1540 domain-containing protein [Firmicutes bacterium]|nr:DUF1540 domain-containing protein [Bacillota bacterium]